MMNKYDMQDDATRRKVFWLLQRITSFSLWKAKEGAFKVFADAYETGVKTWPANDPETLEADHLKTIYEILNCYDKGLAELAKGRRFVWRSGQALWQVVIQFGELDRYFYRNPSYWEHGGQFETYPLKVDALYQLLHQSQFQADHAPLEVSTRDPVARLRWPSILLDSKKYAYGFYELAYPTFPEVLPEVPDPTGLVIESGQTVPRDGIWEPVVIEQNRMLGVIPIGAKLFSNNGCFNYLVAGVVAPNFSSTDVDTFAVTLKPTHWRLLWEDTRYLDGVIPDESQYFLEAATTADPANDDTVEPARTGNICPVSGEWCTEEYGGKTVQVEQGATMPDLLAKDNLGELKAYWVTWRLIRRA